MHPKVFREFQRICRERNAGGSVLEIGAVPSEDSLLCMRSLKDAAWKVGVNLEGPGSHNDFKILKADANNLSCFEDGTFDTVLTNATLEHDPFFWKSLAEIRRVTKPGGLVVIGVPGYLKLRMEKGLSVLGRVPMLGPLMRLSFGPLLASTLTLGIHPYPQDFYRFSPTAVREVLLEGMEEVELVSLLIPPRLIGAGRKAHA